MCLHMIDDTHTHTHIHTYIHTHTHTHTHRTIVVLSAKAEESNFESFGFCVEACHWLKSVTLSQIRPVAARTAAI